MVNLKLNEEAKDYLRSQKAVVVTSYTIRTESSTPFEAFVYKAQNEIFIETLRYYGQKRGYSLVLVDAKTEKTLPCSEPYYEEVRGFDDAMQLDLLHALYES